jgi:RNA polymerase sigma-70 factor (ECF subfamily)
MYALRVTSTFVPPASSSEQEPAIPRDVRDDDAKLVREVLRGDRRAEEALYRRHAHGILRLASRLLRSTEDARDVLHDTFVIAFAELSDLREANAVRGWLHTICVRLVHRRFRKRKMLRFLGLDRSVEDARLEAVADPGLDPAERSDLAAVDRAMDHLPAHEKVAWILRHVEGLSLDEVAQSQACSLATAKRRIAAADAVVQRLREGRP